MDVGFLACSGGPYPPHAVPVKRNFQTEPLPEMPDYGASDDSAVDMLRPRQKKFTRVSGWLAWSNVSQ
jgi:hypothetical protein